MSGIEYTQPDILPTDKNFLEYFHNAKKRNVFDSAWRLEDRIVSWEREKYVFEINRRLCYTKDNPQWRETQDCLMIEELSEVFNTIGEYYEVDPEDIQHVLGNIIHEISVNAFDHAKSDLHATFQFSKKQEGILFVFTLADEGPGIKQHLLNLFADDNFMNEFRKKGHYTPQILDLLEKGENEQVYQKYLSGEGESTRLEDQRGFFLGYLMQDTLEVANVDLLIRDGEYEHTFSNKNWYLSHQTIKSLPYKLVYHGAKLFPQKPE